MKIAFLYAGQGSQVVNMGLDLYENNDIFKQTIDRHDKNILNLLKNGTLEEISKTENTQPLMTLYMIALTNVLLSENIKPDMLLGLSLGEYSALFTAGVLTEETAIDIIKYRGKIMSKTQKNTAMCAIMFLDAQKVTEAVNQAKQLGKISVANYNSPTQIVISGEKDAVLYAEKLCKEFGAKKTVMLNVSGAFHSPLMEEVSQLLFEKIKDIKFEKMQIPVVFNALGREKSDNEDIRNLLARQVKESVYFMQSIEYMISKGIDTFIEIGYGKVLSSFVKKINKDVNVFSVFDVNSLEKLKNDMGVLNV